MSDIQGSSTLNQIDVFQTDIFSIFKKIDNIYQHIPYHLDGPDGEILYIRINQLAECLRGLCAINIDLLNKIDQLESKLNEK